MNSVKIKTGIIGVMVLTLLLTMGCFTHLMDVKSNKRIYRSNNNPFIYKMHPEFRFYHSTNGNNLYVKLNLQEFMFAPIKSSNNVQGKVQIKYLIYATNDFETPLDSANFNFDLKKRKGQTSAVTYLPIKENGLSEYYIKVITIDLLKRVGSQDFVYVNYDNENANHNFLTYYHNSGVTYFRPYLKDNESIDIGYNQSIENLLVKHFSTNISIPTPPYSTEPYIDPELKYDSLYSVSGGVKVEFKSHKKGLYCIQKDTMNNFGVYLISVGEDFPFVKSSKDMVYPLEYICKTKEFKDLLNSSNKKLALDRFWIKCGGNMNRARELIRIYYNRVLYANVYFTSYIEGWKTDRGMIYLLFGTPKSVKKGINKEVWNYSDRYSQKFLQFVFNRQQSPYSHNVFVLERSNDFRKFWIEARRSWREGKVYTVFR